MAPKRKLGRFASAPLLAASLALLALSGCASVEVQKPAVSAHNEIVVEAQAGINRLEWNLLVDADLALAAERAKNDKLAEDARKAAETPEKATDTDDSGRLAKTPYAESVRLGHRLYLLPGDYTLQLQLAGHTSETPFVVAAPEPRKPRATPAPKIRGKED